VIFQTLEDYVSHIVMSVIASFFNSRFSEQTTTIQARQPVFVKLLQGAYSLSHCSWLSGIQTYHVETCIRTLSNIGVCLAWLYYECKTLFFYGRSSKKKPKRLTSDGMKYTLK